MSISLLVDTNDRFKKLQDIGFKSCLWVDEDGIEWVVLTIGSPDQGYKPSEIADMSNGDFENLISAYIN